MSNIDELQSRITSAMDRIGAGLEVLAQRPSAPDAGLAEALEEEKLANAQLKERLRALNQKHFEEVEQLQAKVANAADSSELDRLRRELAEQHRATARLDADIQRLRQANDQLRLSNAALREAGEAGVVEPHLINKSMLAELEGLRATRAADASEAAAVLARLEPLLAEAAQTGGEGA